MENDKNIIYMQKGKIRNIKFYTMIIAMILSVTCIVSFNRITVFAWDFAHYDESYLIEGDWLYEVTADGKAIIHGYKWTNTAENVKTPTVLGGHKVVGIGSGGAEGTGGIDNDYIRNLTISEGIQFIDEWAAIHGSNIRNIKIPSTVTSIGNFAFMGRNIKKFEVSSKNKYYSSDKAGCLYDKKKTKFIACPMGKTGKLKIAGKVRSIEKGAFYCTEGLSTVILPKKLKQIKAGTFVRSGLKKILLPDTLKLIGINAFVDCDNLTSVTIPKNVTNIERGAFMCCRNLKKLKFAKGSKLKKIGDYAFAGNWSMKGKLVLPSHLQSIGNGAFDSYVDKINKVYIPKSVKKIGDDNFIGKGKTIVYGKKGSAAYKYAKKNKLKFRKWK